MDVKFKAGSRQSDENLAGQLGGGTLAFGNLRAVTRIICTQREPENDRPAQ